MKWIKRKKVSFLLWFLVYSYGVDDDEIQNELKEILNMQEDERENFPLIVENLTKVHYKYLI